MIKKRFKQLLVFMLTMCVLCMNVIPVFAETVTYSNWNGESLYNINMEFSDDKAFYYKEDLPTIANFYVRFHRNANDVDGDIYECTYWYGDWHISVSGMCFYTFGAGGLNAFNKDTASLILDDSNYDSTGKVDLILDVPFSSDNTSTSGGTTEYFQYTPVFDNSNGTYHILFEDMKWFNMLQDYGILDSTIYHRDGNIVNAITADMGYTMEYAEPPNNENNYFNSNYFTGYLHFSSDSYYLAYNRRGGSSYYYSSEIKLEYLKDIGKLATTVTKEGIIEKTAEVDGSYAVSSHYLRQGDVLSPGKVYLLSEVMVDSHISYDSISQDFDTSTIIDTSPHRAYIGSKRDSCIYVDGVYYKHFRYYDVGSGNMVGFNPFLNTASTYKVDNICLNTSSEGHQFVIFLSTVEQATEIIYKNFYTDEVIGEPDDISDGVNLPSGYKYFVDQYNNFIDTDALTTLTSNTTVYCVPDSYSMPYYNGDGGALLGNLDLSLDESTLETRYSGTEFVNVKYGSTESLKDISTYWADQKGRNLDAVVDYGTEAYSYVLIGGTEGCVQSNANYKIVIPKECSLSDAHTLADTRGELIEVFKGVNKLEFDLKNYEYSGEYFRDIFTRINAPLNGYVSNTSDLSVLYAGDYQILFLGNTNEVSGNCSSGVFIVEPGSSGRSMAIDIIGGIVNLTDVLADTTTTDAQEISDAIEAYNNEDVTFTLTDDGKFLIESDDIRMFPKDCDTSSIEGNPSTVPLDSSDFCKVYYNKQFTKTITNSGIGHDFTQSEWQELNLSDVPNLEVLRDYVNALIYNKADLVIPEYYGLIEKIEVAQCSRSTSLCTDPKPVAMRITTKNTAPIIKKSEVTLIGTDNESIDTTTLTVIDAEGDLVTLKVDGAERTVTNHSTMDVIILADDQVHTITAIDSEDNETEVKIKVLTHAPQIVDVNGNSLESTILDDLLFKVTDRKNDVVKVTDNGNTITPDSNGIYTITASEESDESHTIVAVDASNNQSEKIVLIRHKCTGGAPVIENTIYPTCTDDGSYDEVVHCKVCNAVLSTTPKTTDKVGHNWNGDWENIEVTPELLQNAENSSEVATLWENDGYHRVQIKYCSNTNVCSSSSAEKAYKLRVLVFEFEYDKDTDRDGKPNVTINVKDALTDTVIDTVGTDVEQLPVVKATEEDKDDYVPYRVSPETNDYNFTTVETKNYSIPTVTVTINSSAWREFINTITFGVFFKETQVGTITTEYKNSENPSSVLSTGYFIAKNGNTFNSDSIKSQTFTNGTSFTLTKEDSEKFVVYTEVVLDCGYTVYTSSDGVVIDTIKPTIDFASNENYECMFDTETITVKDNIALKSIIIDGVEEPVLTTTRTNEKIVVLNNDNASHTIKAIDKAGNETTKTIKFKEKPAETDFVARVEGKIVDILGNPIVGAKIELHSTVRTTTTDENGEFSFDNVEVEGHSLTAKVNDTVVYDVNLEMTPIYASATVNEVSNSFAISSDYVYTDNSLTMSINAAECENHVHGRVERENVVDPTCTLRGSYDLVDYCPNCNGIYNKVSEFTNALGHLWSDDSWVLVEESDRTDALYSGAVNTVDRTQLNYNHALFKRDCGRNDVYELSIKEIPHTCTPSAAVEENRIEPTCTIDGSYDEVVYCSVCNGVVSRVNKSLTRLGHDWDSGEITVMPTCTEDGTRTHTCNRCAATKDIVINKLGHNQGEPVEENRVEATCTTDGSYDEVVYCTRCDVELSRSTKSINKLGHDPAESVIENRVYPTCTTDGSYDEVVYCNRCDVELSRDNKTITKLGHVHGTPIVENRIEPTCVNKGSYDEVVYCNTCHAELSRTPHEIDAKGHKEGEPVYENIDDATCTEKGSYDKVVYCSVCTVELSRTHHTNEVLGHDWDDGSVTKEPTCTEDGIKVFTCKRCRVTREESLNKLGHVEGNTVIENRKDATCTTKGSYDEVIYCTVCKVELSRKSVEVDVLGHDWDKGVITKEPTCTETGVKTYTCNRCAKTRTETVPKVEHDKDTPIIENSVKPTCTEKGSHDEVVYCKVCNTELSRDSKTVEALGHKWDAEWELCEEVSDTLFDECENDIDLPDSLENYLIYKQVCSNDECDCYQIKLEKEKEPEKEPIKEPEKEPTKEPEKEPIKESTKEPANIDTAVSIDKKEESEDNTSESPKTDDVPTRALFMEFILGALLLYVSIKNAIKKNRRL